MREEPYWAEEASLSELQLEFQLISLSEFHLETLYVCMMGGKPSVRSMFIDLKMPMNKLTGIIVKHSAVYVNENIPHGVACGDRSSVEGKGPRQ
ncbi:MAG: hypothetical protein ACKPKO_21480 [Candidatus Fonsibacter sp.]